MSSTGGHTKAARSIREGCLPCCHLYRLFVTDLSLSQLVDYMECLALSDQCLSWGICKSTRVNGCHVYDQLYILFA
jgi:hypothetical protein